MRAVHDHRLGQFVLGAPYAVGCSSDAARQPQVGGAASAGVSMGSAGAAPNTVPCFAIKSMCDFFGML
jgi:hypothetical protein